MGHLLVLEVKEVVIHLYLAQVLVLVDLLLEAEVVEPPVDTMKKETE